MDYYIIVKKYVTAQVYSCPGYRIPVLGRSLKL